MVSVVRPRGIASEVYRGVMVWNQSRKHDTWGRQRQRPRDQSEWMRIEAPELRIVPESLWIAVQERLSRRRAVYLDRTGGQTHGRPLAGTVSPYLLTGFVSCGCCSASMVVTTTPHRRVIHPRLQCWYYKTRGVHICGNRWQPALSRFDELVLSVIEQDVLAPHIVEALITRAVEILAAEHGTRTLQTDTSPARSQRWIGNWNG